MATPTITDPTLTQGTDASGQSVYVSDPSLNPQFSYGSTPISTASLTTPAAPINVGTPPSTNAYGNHVDATQATLDALTKNADPSTALFKQYMDGQEAPPSVGTAPIATAEQQKAIESQNKVDAINAQLAGLNYQYNTLIPNQAIQDATGRMSTAGIASQTAISQRQKMLDIAPLQFQALVAQAEATGNQRLYQAAQDHLDKVFQVQQTDATNQYNYKKDLRDRVYEFATAQQKAKLDTQQKMADQNFELLKENLANAKTVAGKAFDNGQSDLASKIIGLDPHSPTYVKDLTALESQIVTKSTVRVIGSATTGYYSYDERTGKTTPISAGGGKGGGTTPAAAIPTQHVTALKNALNASKFSGPQADGKYANTALYVANFNSWVAAKNDPAVFFKSFPPKTYINPNDATVPPEIKKFIGAASGSFQ